jgi:hypothetical protein
MRLSAKIICVAGIFITVAGILFWRCDKDEEVTGKRHAAGLTQNPSDFDDKRNTPTLSEQFRKIAEDCIVQFFTGITSLVVKEEIEKFNNVYDAENFYKLLGKDRTDGVDKDEIKEFWAKEPFGRKYFYCALFSENDDPSLDRHQNGIFLHPSLATEADQEKTGKILLSPEVLNRIKEMNIEGVDIGDIDSATLERIEKMFPWKFKKVDGGYALPDSQLIISIKYWENMGIDFFKMGRELDDLVNALTSGSTEPNREHQQNRAQE